MNVGIKGLWADSVGKDNTRKTDNYYANVSSILQNWHDLCCHK